ncbi:hypothetical protein B296_00023281 [Ensete ventricosum]|uniref:Uncharacterized protein n=1 Tax=Ensete ventricosum TaxID=4639 RepID=A0A426XJE6_ENSVE|nr:hypothetical protein B296_00023281 [Ensete ventricosum]
MGTLACSTAPVKGGDYMAPARGYHPQPALPPPRGNDVGRRGGRPLSGWLPAGKGSCYLRRGSSGGGTDGARGVGASFLGKDDPAPLNFENFEDSCVFLVYCWAYEPVIICNYMERRSRSVEVTAGPTMPWREITTHGDATIRQN